MTSPAREVASRHRSLLRRIAGGKAREGAAGPGTDLAALVADGLAEIDGDQVRLTALGKAALKRALVESGLAGGAASAADVKKSATPPVAPRVSESLREGPLGWLASRRDSNGRALIDPVELAAGERLASDFERAQLRQRVTASWDPTAAARRGRGGSASTPSDIALDARRRLRTALDAVGSDLAAVLWAVCCEDVRLEELERRHGWPRRCAKVVLAIALRRLAGHYGMAETARGPERTSGSGAIRHWGAEDYRPRVDGGLETEEPQAAGSL